MEPDTNQFAQKLPLAFWKRHVAQVARYATCRKILNAARAYLHYRSGASRVSTKPCFLKVEVSRKCRINCKYCFSVKEDVFYPLEDYKKLIDEFKDFLFEVTLYEVGEPLYHDQLLEFISYAHANRVGSVISSSFSLEKPDAFWKGLAVSGLDRLVVAIDGVTDEVYNQYRTNGRLGLVMANLRRIVRYRNESSSRLRIEWQMLDLPWNRHEQDTAKKLAAEIGCDTFRLIPEAILPRQQYTSQAVPRKRNCLLPYIILIVDAYNRARPCYKPDCNPGFLGNLKDSTAAEIWNNDEIASIRNRSRIRLRPGCMTCQE